MKKSNQVKIYELLFEQDSTTISGTSISGASTENLVNAFKQELNKALGPVAAQLKQLKFPNTSLSATPSTTSPKGTTSTTPSKPAGIIGTSSASKDTDKNDSSKILNDPKFTQDLADKVAQAIEKKKTD